jgi:NADPH-dependent glutamate synthase beta subunit-like oxidoreductase
MQIVGRGKVERVDFCECVSVFDEEGRFAPTLDSGRCASQEADRVLLAIGQEPDLGFLDGVESIRPTAVGYIGVGAESMQTSIEGVFAAGEVVSGPASVVEAIGQARRAASGIDRYLGGSGDLHFRLLEEVEPDAALGRVEGLRLLPRPAAAWAATSDWLSPRYPPRRRPGVS